MNCFIVMQGHTYQKEKELGIVWSPQQDKGGNVPPSWKRLTEVKAGDRVFHYVRGQIVAISVAKEDWKAARKPAAIEDHPEDTEGYIVPLHYHELEHPLPIREAFSGLLPHLPMKYSPFQEDGNGNSGYLYPCNEELAIKLLEYISETNIYYISEEQLELSVDEIVSRHNNTLVPVITETESEAKAKLRLGQQKFRRVLLPLWHGTCALCGIALPELLRASYAKPWKDSTNAERLDPYNGVLLCHNHHALYEKGFITFDVQGRLHISPVLAEDAHAAYGLHAGMKMKLHRGNKVYFKWHRKHIFQGPLKG